MIIVKIFLTHQSKERCNLYISISYQTLNNNIQNFQEKKLKFVQL